MSSGWFMIKVYDPETGYARYVKVFSTREKCLKYLKLVSAQDKTEYDYMIRSI